jgi:serine phosphatase RsbU (regulator of sigma subunit)
VADWPVEVAAATRPYPGESANGDAWATAWPPGACRIAVVDGLGHGPAAAAAAAAATAALAAQPELGPVEALQLCHGALAKSRGAAIAIARIDPADQRLTYAGVGNVEARLWSGGEARRLIAYRGVIGVVLPRTIRAFEHPLDDDWLLLLHTDGVSSRFALDGPREAAARAPAELAAAVLAGWGRPTDDATVVVARTAKRERG